MHYDLLNQNNLYLSHPIPSHDSHHVYASTSFYLKSKKVASSLRFYWLFLDHESASTSNNFIQNFLISVLAILGMDRFGRKFFLIFSTLTAGICSAGMYFVTNKQQNFIVSAIFTGIIACGNASLDCLITEVFPTHLRATGGK